MSPHVRRVRRARVRRLAGVVVAAAVLSAAAGCGGESEAEQPKSSKAGRDATSVIAGLKVCQLTSLAPLVKVLGSPGYESGPAEVAKGSGVEPAGPQCAAQLKLPQLTNVAGNKEDLVPARLMISVAGYGGKAEADERFAARLAEAEKLGGTTKDLPGAWTVGKLVTAELGTEDVVAAQVQQDNYVIRIYLQITSDSTSREKFRFTTAQVASTVATVTGSLHSAVSAKVQ
ncbi:hypothetical protein OHB24_36355 [Kribbella sp. NBC_00482]|uniref:hypothetical protein n=1 Tax=Kribbella sp. NBC_00482 TaxID=2975968 RepID=UPI002E190484